MSDRSTSTWTWWQIDACGLAMCILMTLAGYLLIIQPLVRSQELNKMQTTDIAAKQERASDLVSTVSKLQSELAQLQKALSENPVELQSSQHSNQRLADLTHLAASSELNVFELHTGETQAASRYEIIPIVLSGTGTFQSCTKFLHVLREQFPDTGVVSVDLSDNPGDPTVKTSFKFNLSWYAAPALSSAHK